MLAADLGGRFFETTRGQIVALLRRGSRTVEDLVHALSLTDNAIRSHLSALERDGLVRQEGVRRGTGAGKPASVYQIEPDAEALFSRAYAPVLGALLDELAEQMPAKRREALMQGVGRRLAAAAGRPPAGGAEARARAAAALLNSLGAEVQTERSDGVLVLRGCTGCPLSVAVARRPELCRTIEALLSEFVGMPVRECCDHGDKPRCCFQISTGLAAG